MAVRRKYTSSGRRKKRGTGRGTLAVAGLAAVGAVGAGVYFIHRNRSIPPLPPENGEGPPPPPNGEQQVNILTWQRGQGDVTIHETDGTPAPGPYNTNVPYLVVASGSPLLSIAYDISTSLLGGEDAGNDQHVIIQASGHNVEVQDVQGFPQSYLVMGGNSGTPLGSYPTYSQEEGKAVIAEMMFVIPD